MSDPLANPYAPPATPPAHFAGLDAPDGSPADYEGERRSVILLLLFCVVTFGLYPSFWYLRRARFLDSLTAAKKVGPLPWISVALNLASVILAVFREEPATRLVQAAGGLVNLFLAFRVAAILRSDFRRTGRSVSFSSVGVFFFGCLYLQHVLNEAADVKARWPRTRDATTTTSGRPSP